MRSCFSVHKIDPLVELSPQRPPQMAVRVERRGDAGVPETCLDFLGMSPVGDQEGSARVAQVVKAQGRIEAALSRAASPPAPCGRSLRARPRAPRCRPWGRRTDNYSARSLSLALWRPMEHDRLLAGPRALREATGDHSELERLGGLRGPVAN
jgi:hypothetical protein